MFKSAREGTNPAYKNSLSSYTLSGSLGIAGCLLLYPGWGSVGLFREQRKKVWPGRPSCFPTIREDKFLHCNIRTRSVRPIVFVAVALLCTPIVSCFTNPIFGLFEQLEESDDTAFLLTLLLLSNSGEGPLLPNGRTWTNHQLVIDIGTEGSFDTVGVSGPSVVKVGSTYHMWYSGDNGTDRVLYANSADGITWSNHQMVINTSAEGNWDTSGSYSPAVYYDAGVFKMYYSGFDGTNVRLLYADSADGVTWSNHTQVLDVPTIATSVDGRHAFSPMLNGDRLWYTAVNTSLVYQIGTCVGATTPPSLSSCQLSIPTGNEGTHDTASIATGDVFLDGSVYKVWYAGSTTAFDQDIIYCESLDGIQWGNCVRSISRGTLGTQDANRVSGSSVLVENHVGRMWYFAADTGNTARIFYAESY